MGKSRNDEKNMYMLFHFLDGVATRPRVVGRINRNTTTKGGIKCLLPLIGRC